MKLNNIVLLSTLAKSLSHWPKKYLRIFFDKKQELKMVMSTILLLYIYYLI